MKSTNSTRDKKLAPKKRPIVPPMSPEKTIHYSLNANRGITQGCTISAINFLFVVEILATIIHLRFSKTWNDT
jgi:hypothetical protein